MLTNNPSPENRKPYQAETREKEEVKRGDNRKVNNSESANDITNGNINETEHINKSDSEIS